jgi:prepilin-type N-terminal cleavage/methylation domain-containing protein
VVATVRAVLRRRHQADGFTLIELIVALTIATVVFSAMAAAGLAGVRASVVARQNQQAVDVLNRAVEQARSVSYASLAMVTSDLQVGDDAITPGSPPSYDVPNGIGSEEVWADDTGSVNPHVETVTTANGIDYTTRTYVTVPTGYTVDTAGQPDQKRLTVVATWDSYGDVRERVISTLLTETARGLPLPRYSVTPTSPTTQTKNPNSTLTWGFQVINRGARDTFNIAASSGTWIYRIDTDCNGISDVGESTELTNTDSALGDTQVDTGPLEPNNYPPFCVTATRSIPSSELGTSTVTFTLTSSAQPSADGAVVTSPIYTVDVTTGSTGGTATPTPTGTGPVYTTVCEPTPAGAGTPFGFRNGAAGVVGDTTSTLVNLMTENVCLYQDGSPNYSTDAGAGAGRSLTTGGSDTSTSASGRVEWRWDPGATRRVTAGTAYVSVMVSCPIAGPDLELHAAVGQINVNNSAWTSKAKNSVTISCAAAGTWTRAEIPISVGSQFNVTSTNRLSVRLWVTGGNAGQQLRLDFETVTAKSFFYAKVT